MNTITASALYHVITEAMICAGRDDSLPMLTCVKLETTAGQLIAVCTDRFRMGVSRAPIEGTDTIDMLIDGKQAKTLAALLKPQRGRFAVEHKVEIESVGEPGSYTHKLKWSCTNGTSGTIDTVDAGFPKWRGLIGPASEHGDEITDNHETPDAYRFRCNPKYLAEFAKAARGQADYMTVEPMMGSNRPIAIRVGEHFLGLLMPVRNSEHAQSDSRTSRAAWRDIVS